MKKMSKQDVETVIFENAKTGEALEFQHEQHKAEYGAKHFWKADKKFFELLSTFSAAESKVVAYILQKTQPTKNEFIGAYKTIARKLECDVTTVRNTFKKMMENDMLAKTDDERIWMLNPRLLVKGDIIVKARLMSKYDSLLGRPLSDWIITDSNGNDPLFLPIEYPTPESLDTAKSDFIKVYHLFFETLSGLGGKESEVLNFLVCAMRNSDNTYTGPMKKIAENSPFFFAFLSNARISFPTILVGAAEPTDTSGAVFVCRLATDLVESSLMYSDTIPKFLKNALSKTSKSSFSRPSRIACFWALYKSLASISGMPCVLRYSQFASSGVRSVAYCVYW